MKALSFPRLAPLGTPSLSQIWERRGLGGIGIKLGIMSRSPRPHGHEVAVLLPNYIAYVERQKEHHAEGTIIPILERMTSEDMGPRLVREDASLYVTEADSWREELMKLYAVTEEGAGKKY